MINNQSIKGEYFFDINIYTMFGVYNIYTSNHNLITNDGVEFFLKKCVSAPTLLYYNSEEDYEFEDYYGYIGYIGVGDSNKLPQKTDTRLIELKKIFEETSVSINDNKIILNVKTNGESLDETCEIGVYTTKNILVSRDVHTQYTLPETASVNLTYTFTLNQSDKSEEDNIEEDIDD